MALLLRAVALALALAAALTPAASASFPGENGRLVLSIENCYFQRYLVSMPWRGGKLRPLTERCAPAQDDDETTPPTYSLPEASPDGTTILAHRCGRSVLNCWFVTMNADGSDLTEVPKPDQIPAFGYATPSFAPDGERFVWEADQPSGGYDAQRVWEVPLDGSEPRVIRKRASCGRDKNCAIFEDPRWSPDGRLIAVEVTTYNRNRRARRALPPGIWLIRARDGKPVRRLTKHTRGGNLDWSPDGQFIVYRTAWYKDEDGGASGGNLYVVSRDGKTKRELVHRHGVAETDPAWSPDGRWIAWVSIAPTAGDVSFTLNPSLWRVRATGGEPRLIQALPEPWVDEGEFTLPQLTWLPSS